MPTIRQLPPSLVNKIAAGEVIERPASVVKELMENSIDAGAQRIELTIEGGGLELIRISDDGCGIDAEQVPLALASHATSKLERAEDLFEVRTLGFRGEALASIAEISHLMLRTRTSDSDCGCEVQVRGGTADAPLPAGCPVGTTIEVRNLFFNTPVRRKFLRTPQTETNHIVEAFTRIALAFPQVHMKLLQQSRVTFDLPASDSWKQRIRAFFGEEVTDSLIAVESAHDEVHLSGFVADPSVSRSNNRMQYLFLNGRYIRDRSLQHALAEAYRGLLMTGRFPVCFLKMQIPADMVDVNVHPTKMEVRFVEGGKLYSQLLQTLRHQFLQTDLTARARHVPGPLPAALRNTAAPSETMQGWTGADTDRSPSPSSAPFAATPEDRRWQQHTERMSHVELGGRLDLRTDIPQFRPFPGTGLAGLGRIDSPFDSRSGRDPQLDNSTINGTDIDEASHFDDAAARNAGSLSSNSTASPADGSTPMATTLHSHGPHADGSHQPATRHLGIQVHNRYLVTQDEQGMIVVDQHALHERILYEQLRQRTEQKNLESQQLLIPEPIDLTPAEAAAAIEHRDVLAKIGIEVEAFGGDTILMTSYPAMLANMRPAEVLRQVLEPLMAGGQQPSARDVLDELLHMLACKAAIKAGDRLSPEEITALLEQRYHYQDSHHCPHGRPTTLHFSREQLDKMFKRT